MIIETRQRAKPGQTSMMPVVGKDGNVTLGSKLDLKTSCVRPYIIKAGYNHIDVRSWRHLAPCQER